MFKHRSKYFKGLDLMVRKRIYPYEYMKDISKFKKTELLPKEVFASWLNAGSIANELRPSKISEEDCQQAQVVFKTMSYNNLKDYMTLCCKLYCPCRTSCCWPMFSRVSSTYAWTNISWTRHTTLQPRPGLGRHVRSDGDRAGALDRPSHVFVLQEWHSWRHIYHYYYINSLSDIKYSVI